MIEINLIPDVKQELLRAQRTRAAVISISILISIIAGGVVVLLALYVFGAQTIRSSVLDDATKKQYATFSSVEDLSEMLTIQNQLDKIGELNQSKTMTSRFFDALAAVTPPAPNEVQISTVNINTEDKTINLEGHTRAYDSMEVFKKTLDSAVIVYSQDGQEQKVKLASDISTGEAGYSQGEGGQMLTFNLSFVYAEELFSPAITAPIIKLSVNGNVTDSYLGVPRSIFTDVQGGSNE